MKCKILLVGYGWRSQIYRRAIANLSNEFELCGVLMRSEQRALEIEKEIGIRATDDFDTALSWDPDFVILCVSKVATKEWLIRFMKHQIPVLCETPPAGSVEELNEIWKENIRLKGKVQIAEQYFLQPYYRALQNIVHSGILGEILTVNMSAIHGYHAMSIFRKLLGIGFENCTITGNRYELPVTITRNRAGWHETGEVISTIRDRADMVFDNGKIAFFDFDKQHYFSPIRSRRWNVQGIRGEIQNDMVCYLNERNQPITERMYREDDGINNIDGWSHRFISFRGERIYENPFPGLRINDDEIAVTDLLVGMKHYLETGEDIYSLQNGLQDAYLDLMREEAIALGKSIRTTNQSWICEVAENKNHCC